MSAEGRNWRRESGRLQSVPDERRGGADAAPDPVATSPRREPPQSPERWQDDMGRIVHRAILVGEVASLAEEERQADIYTARYSSMQHNVTAMEEQNARLAAKLAYLESQSPKKQPVSPERDALKRRVADLEYDRTELLTLLRDIRAHNGLWRDSVREPVLRTEAFGAVERLPLSVPSGLGLEGANIKTYNELCSALTSLALEQSRTIAQYKRELTSEHEVITSLRAARDADRADRVAPSPDRSESDDIRKLKKELNEMYSINTQTTRQLEVLSRELQTRENSVDQNADDLKRVTEELKQSEARYRRADKEMQEMRAKHHEFEITMEKMLTATEEMAESFRTEVLNLQMRCTKADADVERLREIAETSARDRDEQSNLMEEMQRNLDALMRSTAEDSRVAQEAYQELEKELTNEQMDRTRAHIELERANVQIASLEKERELWSKQLEKESSAAKSSQERFEKLRLDYETRMVAAVQAAGQPLEQTLKELRAALAERDEARRDAEEARAKATELEKRLNERRTALEAEYAAKRVELEETARTDRQRLRRQAEAAEQQTQKLMGDLNDTRSMFEKQQEDVHRVEMDLRATVRELMIEVENLKRELDEAQKRTLEAVDAAERADMECATYRKQLEESEAQYNSFSALLQETRNECDASTRQISELRIELIAARASAESAKKSREDAIRSETEAHTHLDDMKNALSSESSHHSEALATLKEELKAANAARDAAVAAGKVMREESEARLDELLRRISENDVTAVKEENARLQAQLGETFNDMQRLENAEQTLLNDIKVKEDELSWFKLRQTKAEADLTSITNLARQDKATAEAQKKELNQLINDMEKRVLSHESDSHKNRALTSEATAKLALAQAELKRVSDELETVRTALADKEKARAAAETERVALRVERDALRVQVNKEREAAADPLNRVAREREAKEREVATRERETANKERDAANTARDAAVKALSESQAEVARLKNEVSSLIKEREAVRTERDALRTVASPTYAQKGKFVATGIPASVPVPFALPVTPVRPAPEKSMNSPTTPHTPSSFTPTTPTTPATPMAGPPAGGFIAAVSATPAAAPLTVATTTTEKSAAAAPPPTIDTSAEGVHGRATARLNLAPLDSPAPGGSAFESRVVPIVSTLDTIINRYYSDIEKSALSAYRERAERMKPLDEFATKFLGDIERQVREELSARLAAAPTLPSPTNKASFPGPMRTRTPPERSIGVPTSTSKASLAPPSPASGEATVSTPAVNAAAMPVEASLVALEGGVREVSEATSRLARLLSFTPSLPAQQPGALPAGALSDRMDFATRVLRLTQEILVTCTSDVEVKLSKAGPSAQSDEHVLDASVDALQSALSKFLPASGGVIDEVLPEVEETVMAAQSDLASACAALNIPLAHPQPHFVGAPMPNLTALGDSLHVGAPVRLASLRREVARLREFAAVVAENTSHRVHRERGGGKVMSEPKPNFDRNNDSILIPPPDSIKAPENALSVANRAFQMLPELETLVANALEDRDALFRHGGMLPPHRTPRVVSTPTLLFTALGDSSLAPAATRLATLSRELEHVTASLRYARGVLAPAPVAGAGAWHVPVVVAGSANFGRGGDSVFSPQKSAEELPSFSTGNAELDEMHALLEAAHEQIAAAAAHAAALERRVETAEAALKKSGASASAAAAAASSSSTAELEELRNLLEAAHGTIAEQAARVEAAERRAGASAAAGGGAGDTAALNKELDALRGAMSDSRLARTDAEAARAAAVKEAEAAKAQVTKLLKNISDNEAALATLRAEFTATRDAVTAKPGAAEELEKAKAEIAKLKSDVDRLHSFQAATDTLAEQLEARNAEIAALKKQAADKTAAAAARASAAGDDDPLKAVQEELNDAYSSLELASKENEELKKELAKARAPQPRAPPSAAENKNAESLSKAEEKIKDLEERLQRTTDDMNGYKGAADSLMAQQGPLHQERNRLEEENASLIKEVAELKTKTAAQTGGDPAELEELKKKLADAAGDRAAQEEKLARVTKDMNNYKAAADTMGVQLGGANKAKNKALEDVEALKAELAAAKKAAAAAPVAAAAPAEGGDLAAVQEELADAYSSLELAGKENESLKKDAAAATKKASEAEAEVTRLTAALNALYTAAPATPTKQGGSTPDEEVASLRARLASLEEQGAAMKAVIANGEAVTATLVDAAVKAESGKHEVALKDLTSKHDAMVKDLAAKYDSAAKETTTKHEAALANAARELEAVKAELQAAREAAKEPGEMSPETANLLATKEAELSSVRAARAEIEREREALRGQLNAANEARAASDAALASERARSPGQLSPPVDVEKLRSQLNEVRQQLEDAQEERDEATSSEANLSASLATERARADKAVRDAEAAAQQVTALSMKLTEVESRHGTDAAAQATELAALRAAKEELEKHVTNLREEMKEAASKADAAREAAVKLASASATRRLSGEIEAANQRAAAAEAASAAAKEEAKEAGVRAAASLSALEAKQTALTAELAASTARLSQGDEASKVTMEALNARVASATEEASKFRETNATLVAQLKSMDQLLSANTEQLGKVTADLTTVRASESAAKAEVARLRAEAEALGARLAESQRDADRSTASARAAVSDEAASEAKVGELTRALNEARREASSAQEQAATQRAAAERAGSDLRTRVDDMERRITGMRDDATARERQLTTQLAAAEARAQTAEARAQGSSVSGTELSGKLAAATAQTESVNAELAKLRVSELALVRKVADLEGALSRQTLDAESAAVRARSEHEQALDRLRAVHQLEAAQSAAQLDAVGAERASLRRAAEEMSESTERQRRKVAELEASNAALSGMIDELRARVEAHAATQMAQATLAATPPRAASISPARQETAHVIDELSTRVAALDEQCTALVGERSLLQSELVAQQREAEVLRGELDRVLTAKERNLNDEDALSLAAVRLSQAPLLHQLRAVEQELTNTRAELATAEENLAMVLADNARLKEQLAAAMQGGAANLSGSGAVLGESAVRPLATSPGQVPPRSTQLQLEETVNTLLQDNNALRDQNARLAATIAQQQAVTSPTTGRMSPVTPARAKSPIAASDAGARARSPLDGAATVGATAEANTSPARAVSPSRLRDSNAVTLADLENDSAVDEGRRRRDPHHVSFAHDVVTISTLPSEPMTSDAAPMPRHPLRSLAPVRNTDEAAELSRGSGVSPQRGSPQRGTAHDRSVVFSQSGGGVAGGARASPGRGRPYTAAEIVAASDEPDDQLTPAQMAAIANHVAPRPEEGVRPGDEVLVSHMGVAGNLNRVPGTPGRDSVLQTSLTQLQDENEPVASTSTTHGGKPVPASIYVRGARTLDSTVRQPRTGATPAGKKAPAVKWNVGMQATGKMSKAKLPLDSQLKTAAAVDTLVADMIARFESRGLELPLHKVDDCMYTLKARKLHLAVQNGALVVRKGGGFESFAEFLARVRIY